MAAALAELIGTFTLTFLGAGAGIQIDKVTVVGVALAHGVALMIIIYSWGKYSGAHVNPAVTLGLAVGGQIEWGKAVTYWVAQFAGAAAAALLLKWLIDDPANLLGSTTGSLTPGVQGAAAGASALKVIVLEAVLTFFLVAAVFSSGVLNINGNLVGVAIGMVLTADILAGGPLTGASMNPARSFGPALATGDLSYLWMYIVGPGLGGVAAALVYGAAFAPQGK